MYTSLGQTSEVQAALKDFSHCCGAWLHRIMTVKILAAFKRLRVGLCYSVDWLLDGQVQR